LDERHQDQDEDRGRDECYQVRDEDRDERDLGYLNQEVAEYGDLQVVAGFGVRLGQPLGVVAAVQGVEFLSREVRCDQQAQLAQTMLVASRFRELDDHLRSLDSLELVQPRGLMLFLERLARQLLMQE